MIDIEFKKFNCVMFKILGEVLMGDIQFGLNLLMVECIVCEVKVVYDMGVEICLVIGGGNIFCGLFGLV